MFGNKRALDLPSSSSKRQKSSLSSNSQWKYDVFLSFRGKDTRDNFTDHLYTALKHKGIITFRDDERLERGKEISSELLESIESSRFSIIIFSKNYASSKLCLEELAKIVKCKDMKVQNVFPVFYKVDPTDVRNQRGDFKTAFDKHEKDFKDNLEMVQRWRSALKQVGDLFGWPLEDGRSETKLITNIVDTIWKRLNINSNVAEDFVGIDSSVKEIYELLEPGSNDTRFIGIWGMGGVGKTTLARVVFDSLSHQYKYEGMCFLANVREVSKQRGLTHLQEMLLSKVSNESNLKICDVYQGVDYIRRWLRHKRVLVVLDDVDNQLEQLEKLAGKHNWFGSGSRIIVTTRDKHVLISHGISSIYELQGLKHDDALQLFRMKAFKNEQPTDDYVELLEKIVQYVKGLPLALVLLGSSLCGRSVEEWESVLNRLRQVPDENILKQLRISYDGLKEIEKKIFLDIACFFKGKNKDRVMEILDSCDFHSTIGIRVLIDKCLITISCDILDMHDLLQEMGWEIVREQHPNNCGEWSRLWQFEDVYHVLTNNKGTHEVEGIMLNKSNQQIPHLDGKSFSSMSKLRLLKIRNVDLSKDMIYLSDELRFLKWDGYPSNSLPSTFEALKLFELNLCHSKIKYLWKGMKTFEKLKNIKLSYSHNLIETPDFTRVTNLETLNLEGCSRLRKLHKSVGFLQRLFMMNLKGCKNLESFPRDIGGLKCLRTLNLENCSKLDKLPQNLEVLECLEELNASGTSIRQVPSSIVKLTNLQKLSFRDCRDQPSQTLMSFRWPYMLPQSRNESSMCLRLPSLAGLHSLTSLVLSGCNLSEGTLPNDLDSLASLKELDLSRNNFVNLPESISRLPKLEILSLRVCKRLQSLPELPGAIYFVGTEHCSSLEAMSWSTLSTSRNIVLLHLFNCFKLEENQDRENSLAVMLLKLHLRKFSFQSLGFHICLPGSEIPAAFKHWSTEGSKIKFGLSSNWYTDELMGIAVCAVVPELSNKLYALSKRNIVCIISIGSSRMDYMITVPRHLHSDHLWLGYLSIQDMMTATHYSDPNDLRCIHVEVKLFLSYAKITNEDNTVQTKRSSAIYLPANRCGIRLVYESELENFEEFPAGSNIFQHNHGDVCDAPDPMSPSSATGSKLLSNWLCFRTPSRHALFGYGFKRP